MHLITSTNDASTSDNGQNPQESSESERRSAPRMSFVFLIRHGENDWVGTGRLAGRTAGVHLNQKGREQSAELADRLGAQPISAIYSSPLERCIETAKPLAERRGLPVRVEAGVLEVDYGDWRAGELKELSKKPEWQLVQIYPGGFRFPDGETLREVQSRAVGAVERLRSEHEGEAIAIFAHGDVIRTTLAYYLGVPLDLFQRIQINTASVSVIGFHRFGPRILRFNDTGVLPIIQWEDNKDEKAGAEQSADSESVPPAG